MRRQMEQAARAGADAVELRLDYLAIAPSEGEIEFLIKDAPVETIATCRPANAGGKFTGGENHRLELLRIAGRQGAAFADVESGTPVSDWPACPIIESFHDFGGRPDNLDEIAGRMSGSAAAVSKIAFSAAEPRDALAALDLLRSGKKSTLALAMGEHGQISRILARKFGAFGTFASLESGLESAPGQPTIGQMKELYRWDSIGPATAVFGVIGYPIAHSMSPAIHNAAFAHAGVDAVYLPIRVEPGGENFRRFLDAVSERPWLGWRGLSVTIPHKENALAWVGAANCDELSARIGAINTITFGPAGPRGDNTDYTAAIAALCSAMGIGPEGLAGRNVAVLGAGGAARAVVAALTHYKTDVVVCNRTLERAEALAEEFGCRSSPLSPPARIEARIIINCTSVGMHPNVNACPLAEISPATRVVFDTIYNPIETALLKLARKAGCTCVSGLDMFVNQAVAQFEIWTGRKAPREIMRQKVLEKLAAADK